MTGSTPGAPSRATPAPPPAAPTCTTGGCRTHPLTPGRWKRTERAALVRTGDQLDAAAKIYSESWQQSHREVCTPDFLAEHTPEAMRQRLEADRAAGWAFYLHSTAGQADAIVGVCHKTGEIGRLYVAPAAQGRGIGAKLLAFAQKKLPEHARTFVTVLETNRPAIALYLRMGYREEGGARRFHRMHTKLSQTVCGS